MANEIVQINADKIAALTGFKPEEIAIVKNTVAKGTTDTELAYFLNMAKSSNLNPFMKEIWCYKDNKGNLLVFAGRDGFLKKAQENPRWNGMTSSEVCLNDKFEMDIISGTAKHVPNYKERGKILGAYAIIKPKGCDLATIEWANFDKYNKGQYTWSAYPEDMIKKVAETHALKKAFGITGLQSEYDYTEKDEIVVPIEEVPKIDIVKQKIISGLAEYEGENKDTIQDMCLEKDKVGEFDLEFAEGVARQIGLEL